MKWNPFVIALYMPPLIAVFIETPAGIMKYIVIYCVINEPNVIRNRMVYAPIVGKGITNFFDDERENYILNKVFHTLFGDMVPNIVANILNQEIFIIERLPFSEYRVTVVSPSENNSQTYYTNMAEESPLILLKTGLHYDACVPVCACPNFRLYQASDFIHVSMNQGRLKCSTPTSDVYQTCDPKLGGHEICRWIMYKKTSNLFIMSNRWVVLVLDWVHATSVLKNLFRT